MSKLLKNKITTSWFDLIHFFEASVTASSWEVFMIPSEIFLRSSCFLGVFCVGFSMGTTIVSKWHIWIKQHFFAIWNILQILSVLVFNFLSEILFHSCARLKGTIYSSGTFRLLLQDKALLAQMFEIIAHLSYWLGSSLAQDYFQIIALLTFLIASLTFRIP